MLRLAEYGLFLLPFAFYLAWVFASRRVRPAVVWIAAVVLAVMAAGTVWFGLTSGFGTSASYVPAHIEGGRIVAGHGGTR